MKYIYRIRANTVTLPRVFSNEEKANITQAEAQRRCDASWFGCGAPRYQNTALQTYDKRIALFTYNKIRENLKWCTFEDKTIIDEVVLDRRREDADGTQHGPWETVDRAAAMPTYDYYMNEDGSLQGPNIDEIMKAAADAGGKYIHRYRVKDTNGWIEPAEWIPINSGEDLQE